MPVATLQRRNFPKTDSEWGQFFKTLAGPFTIDNINPMWPDPGAFLHNYSDWGRIEDWDTAQQRWSDYASGWYWHPEGDDGFEEQLMHGTLLLPKDVLQASHKRLFGDVTDEPCGMAIRAIGFAPFNPVGEQFDLQRGLTWGQVCRIANTKHANTEQQRRKRALAALEDLLNELDS